MSNESVNTPSSTPSQGKTRRRYTPEERLARAQQLEDQRRAKAEEKARKRAERMAAANNQAHMTKVQRAAQKLPQLSPTAETLLADAQSSLSQLELLALAQHLQHLNREISTKRSLELPALEEGQLVTIVGGNFEIIGREGVIKTNNRLHVIVEVDGVEHYLFRSDVQEHDADAEQVA